MRGSSGWWRRRTPVLAVLLAVATGSLPADPAAAQAVVPAPPDLPAPPDPPAPPGAAVRGPIVEYSFREAGPADEALIFTPPGFERVGNPQSATGGSVATLRLRVLDPEGNRTFCRVNVVGPDGNYYEPDDHSLKRYSLTGTWPQWPRGWGNRTGKAPIRYLGRFFYCDGEAEVRVPAGAVRVEVWKGFEYRPELLSTVLDPGQVQAVEVQLSRAFSLPAMGYWSGDPHVHIARHGEEDEQRILDLMEAEDIRYATVLAYNEPAGPYAGFMERMDSPQFRGLGRRSVVARGDYTVASGQEYRSSTFGHLNLFWLDELVMAGQQVNANNWPPYGQVGEQARQAGGFAFHAHGGYGQEVYADAVQGNVDGVELLQFGVYRGMGLSDWYRLLNTGFRFPITAASDYPACRKLGDCQTCVDAPARPTMDDWLRRAADGRSFVTTGPALLLEVDGKRPGDRVELEGDGPFRLKVRVRARCEVAPITHVQLVVNGRVHRELRIPAAQGRGGWLELNEHLVVSESLWVAARAYSLSVHGTPDAESHTNPVYVYRNGRAPYERASLDGVLAAIDRQIDVHKRRTFPEQAQVLAYFEKSRDILVKIREAGGAPSSGHPSDLARDLASLPNPGAREHSDEELKEFLRPVRPLDPAEAVKSFETVAGFQMQLVAHEPLVRDPIAGAFDEQGNLYVCEMRDYPYKPRPGHPPLGSVRLLRDTDGDGIFDESHPFAEEMLWAGGVAPWRGGVFVTAPPDIWYLKDTDGDHRADVRRRVFTGFGTQNQQAMLNNLQWWLDHRIYGSSAGNGGLVRLLDHPDRPPVPVDGRDFRFDPDSGEFESITGTVQFGTTFDDWGNRFLCSESQPLHHAVLPQHYLARNPFLPVPGALHNAAPGPVSIFRISPIERWRMIRSSRRIAHGTRPATSAGASHHVIDAAAGVTIYRGGAYPPEYYGQVFVSDAQNNLVHRRALVPEGVTFRSERADAGTEFLRSSDNWFRPVNLLNAPDGTLYVLDMSREILETIHVPLDVARFVDFRSGRDHGRIYRLAPPGYRFPGPPRLAAAATAELVQTLASPHGWWRDTAHRLLYERKDPAAEDPLRRMASEHPMPQARLHALWSLHGLRRLTAEDVYRGLADDHPSVREQALLLAEPFLDRDERLRARLVELSADPLPRLRMQAAFSWGATAAREGVDALAAIAQRDVADPWIRTAVLSSSADRTGALFRQLARNPRFAGTPSSDGLLEQLAAVAGGRRDPAECEVVLSEIDRLEGRDRQWRLIAALGRPLTSAGQYLDPAAFKIPQVRALVERTRWDAERIAGDEREEIVARRRAVELLALYVPLSVRQPLEKLLDSRLADELEAAVVRAMGASGDPAVAPSLLDRWRQLNPRAREAAMEVLSLRREWLLALLAAARQGDVPVAHFDLARRGVLLKNPDPAIQAAARELFGNARESSRGEVIAAYRAALNLPHGAPRGEQVFRRECGACHRLNEFGTALGPDLTSSAGRDPETLLTHVLDPNQYLLPNYEQYVVVDRSGRTRSGILAAQTATSITLRNETSQSETILRTHIAEMYSTGRSLMPEGFEQKIPLQEMADLIAFLRSVRPASGSGSLDVGTLPGLVEPPPQR